MYLYEFDYSLAAVCAHHVISAAFQSDKHHSSIWVSVQGIQASLDVQLSSFFFGLFFPLLQGVSQHTAPRQMTLFQQVTTEPGATASSVL